MEHVERGPRQRVAGRVAAHFAAGRAGDLPRPQQDHSGGGDLVHAGHTLADRVDDALELRRLTRRDLLKDDQTLAAVVLKVDGSHAAWPTVAMARPDSPLDVFGVQLATTQE